MRIDFAHINAPAASGGSIDYAVFDARSASGTTADNSALLLRLTMKARLAGRKIDQSALAYAENGQLKFWGDKNLVAHLSRAGLPQWTHWIDD